jgi:signal transduction histidine kinase
MLPANSLQASLLEMEAIDGSEPVRRLVDRTRLLLIVGFGGLLLLMAFAGLDAIQVFREMQDRNDAIRQDYLSRNRILNQIRSDLYLSGTYVRDYLLEPDTENADRHLMSLQKSRRDMNSALQIYSHLLGPRESVPFRSLQSEIARYWQVLEPVMRWDAPRRREAGYAFLRDEVFPRRMTMLGIADRIAGVNEQQLTLGKEQASALFSQFRLRLAVTLLITLALGVVLAAVSMRKILQLEHQSNARFDEISLARAELKDLSARLVAAQESERRAISRELHDEVGQSLSALRVGLTNLAALIPAAANGDLREQVESLGRLAETSVGVVRNITLLLRPSMLDDLGLVPALQWQAREVARQSGIAVNVAADGISDHLSEEYKTCIYRVVQEALHNCVRHSGAQNVRITVRQAADHLHLTVQDDGRGLNPSVERGLGLLGMQERVTHLDGSFQLQSEIGRGTVIAIHLPIKPATSIQSTNEPSSDLTR